MHALLKQYSWVTVNMPLTSDIICNMETTTASKINNFITINILLIYHFQIISPFALKYLKLSRLKPEKQFFTTSLTSVEVMLLWIWIVLILPSLSSFFRIFPRGIEASGSLTKMVFKLCDLPAFGVAAFFFWCKYSAVRFSEGSNFLVRLLLLLPEGYNLLRILRCSSLGLFWIDWQASRAFLVVSWTYYKIKIITFNITDRKYLSLHKKDKT